MVAFLNYYPFSTDLTSSDYHLFTNMKNKTIGWENYYSDEDVISAVDYFLINRMKRSSYNNQMPVYLEINNAERRAKINACMISQL